MTSHHGNGTTRVICAAGHTLADVEWRWALGIPIESAAPYLDDLGVVVPDGSRSVDLCLGRVHLHVTDPAATIDLLEDYRAALTPSAGSRRGRVSLPWPLDYQSQPPGMLRRLPVQCACGHGGLHAWLSTRELYRRVVARHEKVVVRYDADLAVVEAVTSGPPVFGATPSG